LCLPNVGRFGMTQPLAFAARLEVEGLGARLHAEACAERAARSAKSVT
jgi:hypothetical protein